MGELIVHGIKIAFWIALALVFMTAISTLLNLITDILFANVIGEVLGIISACLPFDAAAVFGGLATAVSAILAFLIAQKIYELASGKGSNPFTA